MQSRLGNKRELINGAAGGTSIAPLGPNPARSLVLLGRASRAPTAGGWATSLAAPRRQASGGQGCCAQGGAARACALLEGWLREAGGARRPPGRRRRRVLPCRAGAAASRAELPWGERDGSHQLHSATSPRCHLHPTAGGPAVGPPALLVSWAEPVGGRVLLEGTGGSEPAGLCASWGQPVSPAHILPRAWGELALPGPSPWPWPRHRPGHATRSSPLQIGQALISSRHITSTLAGWLAAPSSGLSPGGLDPVGMWQPLRVPGGVPWVQWDGDRDNPSQSAVMAQRPTTVAHAPMPAWVRHQCLPSLRPRVQHPKILLAKALNPPRQSGGR